MKAITNEIEDRKKGNQERKTREENMHVQDLFKCLSKILL